MVNPRSAGTSLVQEITSMTRDAGRGKEISYDVGKIDTDDKVISTALAAHHLHDNHQQTPRGGTGDTAGDISIAVEVKFLLPLYPLRPAVSPGASGTAPTTQPDKPSTGDTTEADRASIEIVDDDQDDVLLGAHGHTLIAHTISRVASQPAVTMQDIRRNGSQERDFWATHWIVKRANSAKGESDATRFPGQKLVAVELCSPKLRWKPRPQRAVTNTGKPTNKRSGHRQGPSTDSEAHAHANGGSSLDDTIGSVLQAVRCHHTVVSNYTCDVHVHVGRADGRPLALESLQRLATMLWLAEDILRSIRNPASPNYRNVYTWGAEIRKYSRLAAVVAGDATRACSSLIITPPSRPDTDPIPVSGSSSYSSLPDLSSTASSNLLPASVMQLLQSDDSHAIQTIQATTSHRQLGWLLSGETRQFRRLGFNFSTLAAEDERAAASPKTVEFRVLEGTLRHEAVLGWTAVCGSLVETAVVGADRFESVVVGLIELQQLRGNLPISNHGSSSIEEMRFRTLMRDLHISNPVVDGLVASIGGHWKNPSTTI
jgi:hypothetical protein